MEQMLRAERENGPIGAGGSVTLKLYDYHYMHMHMRLHRARASHARACTTSVYAAPVRRVHNLC